MNLPQPGLRSLGLITSSSLLIGMSRLTGVDSADDRYDLNTLFKKSLGFMTVDVQGMARVSLFHPYLIDYRLTVRECTSGMPFTLVENKPSRITLFKSRTL